MEKIDITHPSYYTDGKIEVEDFIYDKKLDFCLGNAVKYIARDGKKNPDKILEDLFKSAWYVNREIFHKAQENSDKKDEAIKSYTSEIKMLQSYLNQLIEA